MTNIDQSNQSFSDKWEIYPNLARDITLNPNSEIYRWILERNGFETTDQFRDWLSSKNTILDAGCGNGRVTSLLAKLSSPTSKVYGIDINSATAKKFFEGDSKVEIFKRDLSEEIDIGQTFDFIYCQEVLHHTINPKISFGNLCKLLNLNGEIAIYVYKLKSPIREFTDEFIREKIHLLRFEDIKNHMSQITQFGKALSSYDIRVQVPSVDILQIKEGSYDLQRLIYHFFFKCFWNSELTLDENIAVNSDWYHPQVASKHTLEEVQGWFKDFGLSITHEKVDDYGITIRGKRLYV